MDYCFIQFETTKDDIVRKYDVSLEVAEETETEDNSDEKTATLYVCYYKNDDDKVCQYVWSGDTELLDLEDYYARKRYVCTKCGKRKELCECEKPKFVLQNEEYEELDRDITLSDGSILPAMSEVIKDGQVVMEKEQRQAVNEDGSVALDDTNGVLLPVMTFLKWRKRASRSIRRISCRLSYAKTRRRRIICSVNRTANLSDRSNRR